MQLKKFCRTVHEMKKVDNYVNILLNKKQVTAIFNLM